MKASDFMHFDTLAKHSPVNSEKYAALLFDLIQNLKTHFKLSGKVINILLCLWLHFLSTEICYLPIFKWNAFEMKWNIRAAIWHSSNRKMWSCLFTGLLWVLSCRDKYLSLHNHALFMSLLFGSTYTCEQLFSRMKHIKSKIRTKISDEHLENSLRIAATSINSDIDALVSQIQCQTSHLFYLALFSFTVII